jgi:hypothetical protein
MGIPAQQDREIIEPSDNPLQLHAIHQENGDRHFRLANAVQKYVLDALRFFVGHVFRPLFLGQRKPAYIAPGSPGAALGAHLT